MTNLVYDIGVHVISLCVCVILYKSYVHFRKVAVHLKSEYEKYRMYKMWLDRIETYVRTMSTIATGSSIGIIFSMLTKSNNLGINLNNINLGNINLQQIIDLLQSISHNLNNLEPVNNENGINIPLSSGANYISKQQFSTNNNKIDKVIDTFESDYGTDDEDSIAV